ncbi:MAG: DUF3343 domain-containing protein [Acutalibacteraceae bacterium]|jgi:hypothetical protein
MESVTIEVSSVTAAMRGKSVLERHRVKAYIGRRLEDGGRGGCGYRLIVYNRGEEAVRLLKAAGVRVTRVERGVSG